MHIINVHVLRPNKNFGGFKILVQNYNKKNPTTQ